MAQNISLMGASYSAVPKVRLPKSGGGSADFTDVSDTTAAASDVAQGKYFYTADGSKTQGTNTGGGGGKAFQASDGYSRVAATSYTETEAKLTVEKTGTYTVRWFGYRSSTSGTNGSQLYIGSTAYGSAQTSFGVNSYGQKVKLTGVSLTAGQTITVRARSRSTSYYMYVMGFSIEEE